MRNKRGLLEIWTSDSLSHQACVLFWKKTYLKRNYMITLEIIANMICTVKAAYENFMDICQLKASYLELELSSWYIIWSEGFSSD